jgi:non-specific serine/threonine protein kinase
MLIADRYELDELPLGQGGMGAVHGGHDKHLDRRVAVKFLHLPGGPDDELARRFVREARILARLEHPGAPVLYDFGMFERRLFQVMQFIDGVTIADVVGEQGRCRCRGRPRLRRRRAPCCPRRTDCRSATGISSRPT